MDRPKKLLFTGATGFIGRHVLQHLRHSQDVQVYALVHRNPVQVPDVHSIPFDLLHAPDADYKSLMESVKPDYCLHLAWYTGHKDYLHAEVNHHWAEASKRLITHFYQSGGKRFAGTGTCIEYRAGDAFFTEGQTPLAPQTLYAKKKVEVLEFLREYASAHNHSWAWIRVFYIYGPWEKQNRLVPYIFESLNADKPCTPRYGGLIRDYIHVDDLGRMITAITLSDLQGPVNAGTGTGVAIREVFELAGKITGKSHLIECNDNLTDNEPHRIVANMQKFYTALPGFPNPRPLEQGLTETWAWYRAHGKFM